MKFSQFITEAKLPKDLVGPNVWYALIDAFNAHDIDEVMIEPSDIDLEYLADYVEDGYNELDQDAYDAIDDLSNKIYKLLDDTASVYLVDSDEWHGESQEGNYIEVEGSFDTYRLYHKNIDKIAKLHKGLKVTKGK